MFTVILESLTVSDLDHKRTAPGDLRGSITMVQSFLQQLINQFMYDFDDDMLFIVSGWMGRHSGSIQSFVFLLEVVANSTSI